MKSCSLFVFALSNDDHDRDRSSPVVFFWNCFLASRGVKVDLRMYLLLTFFNGTFFLHAHKDTLFFKQSVCRLANTQHCECRSSNSGRGNYILSSVYCVDEGELDHCREQEHGAAQKPNLTRFYVRDLRQRIFHLRCERHERQDGVRS